MTTFGKNPPPAVAVGCAPRTKSSLKTQSSLKTPNTMTPHQLQDFLHHHIPACAALGIRVVSCSSGRVELLLPHAPNRNHKNTVFGGSTALGATVCGWALVHLNCPQAGGNIVIQSGETRYPAPARGDLLLCADSPTESDWQRCRTMLEQRGKGKITIEVRAYSQNVLAAEFSGRYVVLAA